MSKRIKQLKKTLSLQDWRGLLALIVTVGGLTVIGHSVAFGEKVAVVVVPSVSALMTLVLQWYFKARENS